MPSRDVEDIVQETYVRACQAANKDARNSPRAYLFTIARNLALDYARKAETRLVSTRSDTLDETFSDVESLTNATLDQVITNEQFGEFCRVVRSLPTKQRRAFVLKKVYGYSQREIASEMQISEKTVERHIGLAMQKCFERLDPEIVRSANKSSTTVAHIRLPSRNRRES